MPSSVPAAVFVIESANAKRQRVAGAAFFAPLEAFVVPEENYYKKWSYFWLFR
jgi:hypothetical protein